MSTRPPRFAMVLLMLAPLVVLSCGLCRNSTERMMTESADWDAYGAPFTGDASGLSLPILLADPAGSDGVYVMMRDATVHSIHNTSKGCWFVIGNHPAIRVTFADPKVVVPMEAGNREVMIEGTYVVKEVSEAEARQYLIDDDHGELAKNVVGHRHEPTIIASGIRVAKTL